MKRNIARTTLVILSVVTLYLGLVPAAQAAEHCSTAQAAGNWGFILTGTLIPPSGPVLGAAVGTLAIDHAGNFTGTEARNVGGGFVGDETIIGSLTVKSNCTGTVTAKIYEKGVLVRTVVLAIVFVNESNKFLMVQDSLTLPDGTNIPVVVTLEGNRLSPEHGH
jgi:hypothetical protein